MNELNNSYIQEDNNKNIESILDTYFLEFWDNKNIDINTDYKSIPINTFNASFLYIYNNYIKYNIKDINKPYNGFNEDDFINIINFFKNKALEYNIVSIYGLSLLLGCSKNYIYSIRTSQGEGNVTMHMIEAVQSIFELYQELAIGKANDNTVGLITNINNNIDIGLMYNRQQLIDNYTTKQAINLNDLPKLSDIN